MIENMSLWSLISNASWVVLATLLLLTVFSFFSWVTILQKKFFMHRAQRKMIEFENLFWSGIDLTQLFKEIQNEYDPNNALKSIFIAGLKEYSRLSNIQGLNPSIIMEGTQRAMKIIIAKEQEKLELHLPFLANVGSTTPYIGLFGTVIGIMNSFRGLANIQQATLASVAPGIAEALMATAIGLLTAIPAVMAYNRYISKVDSLTTNYETFADEFYTILHRQIHTNHIKNH